MGEHRLTLLRALGVELRDAAIVFTDRRSGRELPATPPRVATGHELEELERFIHEAGIELGARTNEPKWDGTAMNLAESLDWLLLAETSPECC